MPTYPPVVIKRELDAPIERVYNAWTRPEQLKQWFKGSQETVVKEATVDLRTGGSYRIAVSFDDDTYVMYGSYLTVDPPTTLEFTWRFEDATMELNETIVRIDLEADGDRTKLTLTHSNFSNEKSAASHDQGWISVLATLETYIKENAS